MFEKRWVKALLISFAAAGFILSLNLVALLLFRDSTPAAPGPDDEEHQEAVDTQKSPSAVEPEEEEPAEGLPADEEAVEGLPEKEEGGRQLVLQLFFADEGAVTAAQPGEFGYTAPFERAVPYNSGVLRLALQELIRGPLAEDSGAGRTLPPEARLLNLEIQNGVAIIDFSAEVLSDHTSGTLGGALFIQSVVYTATQFSTVHAVQVLVTGHPWEDGHYFWDGPLSRYDLITQAGI